MKKSYRCVACQKSFSDKNFVGLNKKLLNPKARQFYCLDCLADLLEVSTQDLLDKIEDFKNDGCKLFQ